MNTSASYRYCHQLTRRTAKNFYPAFLVLPRLQRRGMEALYAFMRLTDDLADEPGDIIQKRLALVAWRRRLMDSLAGNQSHPIHAALADTIVRFQIPVHYLELVIEGVEADLNPVAFETFNNLYAYCYRVASAVGLACIHIWGFRDSMALKYAESAGIAFQLTNILRDLSEDRKQGRVYLPKEDWMQFHCPPELWESKCSNFQKLLAVQRGFPKTDKDYIGREPNDGTGNLGPWIGLCEIPWAVSSVLQAGSDGCSF